MEKVEALKRYKFSLAFENSNEEDYVTEKYFQSLVAGMRRILFFLSAQFVAILINIFAKYSSLVGFKIQNMGSFRNTYSFLYLSGSVPVVIGAPNIQDFAPAPGSLLHIKELSDVESVAKRMTYLAENPEAYNQTLR